jgi:pimeloyl-ACP methyl ester carboxylesterase
VHVEELRSEVDGVEVHWQRAGDAPILYVHGVPAASWEWLPFLERTGGVAPDLPGHGSSAKPAEFPYTIEGYDRFLERFTEDVGLERFSLVVHGWGAVALAFAQRFPERIERLVVLSTVPLLEGYRWHQLARLWRTPLLGELAMGFTSKWAWRRSLPRAVADRSWDDFDQGTQRAVLKLFRASPPAVLAAAGERLGELRCPALVLWPSDDPSIPERFGAGYAEALGGEVELEPTVGGHWPWLEHPELVERVAAFLAG